MFDPNSYANQVFGNNEERKKKYSSVTFSNIVADKYIPPPQVKVRDPDSSSVPAHTFNPNDYAKKVFSSTDPNSKPKSKGFDPNDYATSVFGTEEQRAKVKESLPGGKSKTGSIAGDLAVGAADLAVDTVKSKSNPVLDAYKIVQAAAGKTVPEGVFDDAVLGIGKVQGWCGVYASRITTAAAVGDAWVQKLSTARKSGTNQQVDAGYKVVIPLGVTYDKKGNPQGYGHVVVALTKSDKNGNFYAAQSNADGRQEKGKGLGVATYGIFNVNDLKKRYGANWGTVPGKLKVNPYANGGKGLSVGPSEQSPVNGSDAQPSGNWVGQLAGNAIKAVTPVASAVATANGVSFNSDRFKSNTKTPSVQLGSVSGKYESGNNYGRVSSGVGDAGGISYGAHQLAGNNITKFVQASGYSSQFAGLKPGSASFTKKWQQLAKTDQKFNAAQDSYIEKTHYQPLVSKLNSSGLNDLTKRSQAVHEMIYSTGVQYGPNTNIINDALRGKNVSKMSDRDIITAVQKHKTATVYQYFKSSSPDVQAGVKKRIANEMKDLLGDNWVGKTVSGAITGEKSTKPVSFPRPTPFKMSTQQESNDFKDAVLRIIDPVAGIERAVNRYKNPNSDLTAVRNDLDLVGKTLQNRVQEKVYSAPEGTLANNMVTRALGGSVSQVGSGLEKFGGGGTGNVQVVGALRDLVFGGLGILSPGMAKFNTAVQAPVVKDVADSIFGGVEEYNQGVLDRAGVKHGEFRDFLDTALQLGEFALVHKVVGKVVKKVTNKVLNKTATYTPEQVRAALSDVTSGNKTEGITDKMRQHAQDLIQNSAEGVAQKEMLRKSYKEGITVREARDFTSWFGKFFEKLSPKDVNSSFAGLLEAKNKVASGEMTPVEFVKEARSVMAKGESATLRDSVTTTPVKTSPEMLRPMEDGKSMLDKVSEQKARLNELQSIGAKTQIAVEANGGQKVLEVKTYTYSDGKTGVGMTIDIGDQSWVLPMKGAYESPRVAVQQTVPQIERLVGDDSGIPAEAIRQKLDELKTTNFEQISNKSEVLPWEDDYAPKEVVKPTEMTKEQVQQHIDQAVSDYVEYALKPSSGKGVEQGGIMRDERTGEVVGRQGRISNNPEWYQKAVAENGGRKPSEAQLKKIAVDHLMNGVQDHSIGELPPDQNFRALMQALPTAKSESVPRNLRKPKAVEGSGPERVSDTARRLATKAKNAGATEEVDLNTRKVVKMDEQTAKAEDLRIKDPKRAMRIAMGEVLPPEGVLVGKIFRAVEDYATATGDVATLQKLANSQVITDLTESAKNLRAFGDRTGDSPVEAIQSIVEARKSVFMSKLGRDMKVAEQKAQVKKMKNDIKQIERDIKVVQKDVGKGTGKEIADMMKAEKKAEIQDIKDQIKNAKKKIKESTSAFAEEEKAKVAKEAKESIKKTRPTKQNWSDFIESLKCNA